jgi:SEC-C motif-containing protein
MELMRSRYTAYVLGDTPYLRATWADETCPHDLDASADPATRWLGLEIKRHVQVDANHAQVEFVARYKVGGRAHRLHETSRFVRNADGRWLYIDGEINNA